MMIQRVNNTPSSLMISKYDGKSSDYNTSKHRHCKKPLGVHWPQSHEITALYHSDCDDRNVSNDESRDWYMQYEMNEFVRYNADLVSYALQSNPQTQRDWDKLERAMNHHGHSLRGLERYPGMPDAKIREEKREVSVIGLLEAVEMYSWQTRHGCEDQISKLYSRLTSYSMTIAKTMAERDALAVKRILKDDMLEDDSDNVQNESKDDQIYPSASINQQKRNSRSREIVRAIKERLPRRRASLTRRMSTGIKQRQQQQVVR